MKRISYLLTLCACMPAEPPETEPPVQVPRTRRALVIGLDGVRYDAFLQASTPRLDGLVADSGRLLTASASRNVLILSPRGRSAGRRTPA